MKTRKTYDEWCIEGNYGPSYGWERVVYFETREDAKRELKNYRREEPYARFRIHHLHTPLVRDFEAYRTLINKARVNGVAAEWGIRLETLRRRIEKAGLYSLAHDPAWDLL